mgnify:CR=1 FL=1
MTKRRRPPRSGRRTPDRSAPDRAASDRAAPDRAASNSADPDPAAAWADRPWDLLEVAGVQASWRTGMRGHPDVPDGLALLAALLADRGDAPPPDRRLDATGAFGVPARAAGGGRVLERSAAALDALRRDAAADRPGARAVAAHAAAGLPWDAAPGGADEVWIAPRADLGTRAVHADLAAAARALTPDGVALAVLDRDRGAKRYARDAGRWFGTVERLAKRGRADVVRLADPRPTAADDALAPAPGVPAPADGPWAPVEGAAGALALPGTYAAAKLDPGTAHLLAALEAEGPTWRGLRVLDLGCGWGPLARFAAADGGDVVAVDDDLAAVRSARRNVPTADVRHTDLGADLATDDRFDVVLANPPFHVGAGVRTALGRAFVRTAVHRLAPGGTAWIVANADLPYEAETEAAGAALEVRPAGAFKVLRARRRSDR